MEILLSSQKMKGSFSLSVSLKKLTAGWYGGVGMEVGGGSQGAVAVHMPCLLILQSRCHLFSEKVLPNYILHVAALLRV